MALHEVHIEESLRFVLTTELCFILQKLYEADIVGLACSSPTPAVMHELPCSILGAGLVRNNTRRLAKFLNEKLCASQVVALLFPLNVAAKVEPEDGAVEIRALQAGHLRQTRPIKALEVLVQVYQLVTIAL